MKEDHPSRARPNCFNCISFYITHEPSHPYGCRVMGFKSAQLPAMTVYASSGLPCQSFVRKWKKT